MSSTLILSGTTIRTARLSIGDCVLASHNLSSVVNIYDGITSGLTPDIKLRAAPGDSHILSFGEDQNFDNATFVFESGDGILTVVEN